MNRLALRWTFFLAISSGVLAAQTVSVLAFQVGLPEDAEERLYLTDLVSGAMDGLFFSGMIATSQRPAEGGEAGVLQDLGLLCRRAREDRVSWLLVLFVADGEFMVDGRSVHQPARIRAVAVDCEGGTIVSDESMEGPEKVLPPDALKTWCIKAGERSLDGLMRALRGMEEGNP